MIVLSPKQIEILFEAGVDTRGYPTVQDWVRDTVIAGKPYAWRLRGHRLTLVRLPQFEPVTRPDGTLTLRVVE